MYEFHSSLTPAEVAALDSASKTILPASPGRLFVPDMLMLYRPAGGAFTVGAGTFLEIVDSATYPNIYFRFPAEGLLDQTTAQFRAVKFSRGKWIEEGSAVQIRATAALAVIAAVAATNVLTYSNSTNASANQYIRVGDMTYTFVTTVASVGEVKIGASADASFASLAAAVNANGRFGNDLGGAGYDYYVTAPNPLCTAVATAGSDIVTFTARATGTAGNDYVAPGGTVGGLTPAAWSGGVDPTSTDLKFKVVGEHYATSW